MQLAMKRSHLLVTAAGIALGATMSAVADDTELFVSSGSSSASQPNVLLVIDNSASMNCAPDDTSGIFCTQYPAGVTTRLEIVKDVTTAMLGTLEGVNVGLMNFNSNVQGGRVSYAMEDIATARTGIIAAVNALSADGVLGTPLSETMYEAVQYIMGRPVVYGNSTPRSVAESRVNGNLFNNTYASPATGECQQNYIVYLSDGVPSEDGAANSVIPNLPDWMATVGTSNCGDNCLDELAEYLYERDLDPDTEVIDRVITHTIGFAVDFDLLRDTAENGGGTYYNADDADELEETLTDIVLNVAENGTTFTAPAVPVNAFNRTQHLRDVLVSVFEPSDRAHWPGNLKKYRINDGVIEGQNDQPAINPVTGFFADTAWSYWSGSVDGNDVTAGGAASTQPWPNSRNVYTNVAGGDLNASGNRFVSTNTAITAAMLGAPATARNTVIAWARGMDVKDADGDSATNDRRHVIGDPLHTSPVTHVYGGTAENPDMVVFLATNDGYLHAIDPDDGSELWAFIPTQVMGRLHDLYVNDTTPTRDYGLDGALRLHVFDDDGDERAILYFGMRRGGDTLFALEVTNRYDPQLLWTVDGDTAGFEDLGDTWSPPVVTKVEIGDGDDAEKRVAIFGGGYDDGQDEDDYRTDSKGNAVFMVDALTGQLLWSAGNGDSHDLDLDNMEHSIPAPLRIIDLNQNGLADRMYVGDMGGRLWRFDIFNGEDAADLVQGGVLATLGAADLGSPDAADVRRFYSEPDVVPVVTNGHVYLTVNLGSGYRAHPLDTAIDEWFFSVRDFNVFNKLESDDSVYDDPIEIGDLIDVTDDVDTAVAPTDPGWRLEMVQAAGEKVLGPAITFDGAIHFTSLTPTDGSSPCLPDGQNRLYAVSVVDGDPVRNFDGVVDEDGLTENDRFRVLAQHGIAPEPVLLFPEDRPESPVLCIGVECEDAQFDNSPARTIWTQDGAQ